MPSTRPTPDAREFSICGQTSATDARQEFSRLAYAWLPEQVSVEARLALHEVVTAISIVQGADVSLRVRVMRIGSKGVRVEVVSPHSSAVPNATRGLKLVTGLRRRVLNALVDRWGIVLDPAGPYVWFELG